MIDGQIISQIVFSEAKTINFSAFFVKIVEFGNQRRSTDFWAEIDRFSMVNVVFSYKFPVYTDILYSKV